MEISFMTRRRERLKGIFDRNMHLLGLKVLETEEMASRYPQLCSLTAKAYDAQVPPGSSIDGRIAPELENGLRHYGAAFIYRLPKNAFQRLELLANGGLLIDRKNIPNTGKGSQRSSVMASIWPTLRKSRNESCVVAPWPHSMPITYGDFLLFILPRICRIVNRLTAEEKSNAVIAYPLANASWEMDYLGKLGFEPPQIVDTRIFKIVLSTNGVIYAANGEGSGWSERSAHASDYEDARKALWKPPAHGRAPSRRLYLQRKGRRRILNEKDLLKVLEQYNFETIEMGECSITDQMELIADASIILGAQGANLNNMLWSPPGATVIELFNRGFRPSYNRQMAFNLSLNYYYLAQQPMEKHDFSGLNWDITADIDAIGQFLAKTHF